MSPLSSTRRRLQTDLLTWFADTRRDLPWRRTRDPWAILVSELMLQQTQVARVEPRYVGFLERFPDPAACAAAPVGDVVMAWEGLGYNRRAVNLHRTATAVVERHGGVLPRDLTGLMKLPGVGPYTARAVLAFAHEDEVGVLDTNAGRVLARAVAGSRLTKAPAQALADQMVPAGKAWAWNQAVLDLGATVCRSKPLCQQCPIASTCAWQNSGNTRVDPAATSAGVSKKQSRFSGSDRQGRGRVVAALRTGPVPIERLADVTGWGDEPERSRRIADSLVADGLAEYADGALVLPS